MKKILFAITLILVTSTYVHAATNVWGDTVVADPPDVSAACYNLRQTITLLQGHMANSDQAIALEFVPMINRQIGYMENLGCNMSIRHP